MKIPKLQIYTKILIGLFVGIVAGVLFGPKAAIIKPLGTAFIRLITLIVVPLVFASLLVGTASLGDIRKLGRIGVKTIAYYLITTAVAISIGLILANIFRPGSRLPDETKTNLLQNYGGDALEKIQQAEETPGVIDVLLDIIPTNPINSLSTANMLQIIFFALLLGIALTMISSQKAKSVLSFFEGINDAMIQVVHIVMKLAPYGVFALIAAIVGEFGAGILLTLARYSIVVIVGLILHTCLTYPAAVCLLARMNPVFFFRGIRPAQLIAFSTSSSSATLPVTMECSMENLKVPNDVASFVLPLGATINMDGTALYQSVAAVFISEVYGMHLTVGNQLMIVLTATLASIGAAGVPGVGMITLALVLKTIGVPLEGIALILGIDRILDMCRTVTNITGDSSAAVIVAATEGELDKNLLLKN